ncbi:hypothetical protein BGZ61DRAFT_494602 [Ilyonectria robusta]|uniref:uncharacterized protein n=1 Tax=Ilyonectria robusta TaxID=1079257 RepID=UPI001E8E154A|nr:uncharacterized protein BGZ61DRAFT_494602 [Ilyonectria robusta]KAH8688529.1 hypothetical protein BGZ61DRAFT_494602 [Ilyonectria robusta]
MPLAPAVSALARQTFKTAYDELDRTISLGDKRDFQSTTLQHVKKAVLDLENQLAAKQCLRNMRRLVPLFRGLEHYSKVVDVLCNGTPFLPWIWAPITLILRVSSEYVDAFEQIIKGYSGIAESLKRFEILSVAFIDEPEFQQTLAVFYADILQFHIHAYKFIRRSGWKLIFLASWGRFERRFNTILEDLKQHGSLIDQEANSRNIAEARKMREDIRTWREESQSQVRREEVEQNAKQYESITSWLRINESDQLAIFDSISSEATEYQGTCGWILANPKVRSWADSKPDTPALWLKGSAGTGKSVLCTQLINFMKGSKFVVHHFCTYRYASSIMYEKILMSLVLQLLRKDDDPVAHVYKSYVLEKKSPTTAVLEQLLRTLLLSMSSDPNQAEYIWIIIDGLDECELDKQMRLVLLINQLTSKPSLPGSTVCKVLISSRAPSESLQRLRKKQTISLAEEKDCLHGAICQYVGQRLKSLGTKLRQLDIEQPEIEEIQTVVVTKADGMFLYARLVMDYLASNIFFSGDEIKESVNQLPQKLTDFYQKILTQIPVPLDSRSVDRIRCVLGWVAFAERPLQKFELLSAITFSSGNPEIGRLTPQYILDILLHDHGVAAITCLLSGLKVFGNTYRQEDAYLRVAKGLHGFHVYATEYWTEHLLSYAVSADTLNTASSPSLLALACQLADELELALKARSLKNLESRILQAHNRQRSKPPIVSEGISIMLASYQEVVRSLLYQTHYPGLSVDELELFKIHFGTAAFTCRLSSCPRTTLGFETEMLRSEHEMSHVRCFRCTFTGCQYPPFASARALRNHTSKYHTPTTVRKAIRNVTWEHSYQRSYPSSQHSVEPQQPQIRPPPPMYRPSQMRNLPTLYDEEKTDYERGLQGLWDKVNNFPPDSPENRMARQKIMEFSRMLIVKIGRRLTEQHSEAQEQQGKQPKHEQDQNVQISNTEGDELS